MQNHSKLVVTLAKALARIGGSLPRVHMAMTLYQTVAMTHGVAQLYAHIMAFFVRAIKWYSANKLRHVWDSLVMPVELSYADIISSIEVCTKDIESLAMAASWAEQRDMHLQFIKQSSRLEHLEDILLEMRQSMICEPSPA